LNLLEIGRKAVSIDSSISQGTVDIAQYLLGVAINLGLNGEIFNETYHGVENASLWITSSNTPAPKDFLMVSHLDTVEPGEYFRWIKTGANPFQASIDGDNVYGLGTADAKFDFIAKMLALAATEKKSFNKIRPVLVGTFGPESGQGLIKLLRRKKFKPAAALVGRPTGLQLANCGPGYALIEIAIPFDGNEKNYRETHDIIENSHSQSKIFSGINKHGLEPDFYDNPIVKSLEYLKHLPEGMAVISIEGGTSPISAPDIAMLEMDIVDGFNKGMVTKLSGLYEILKNFSGAFRDITAEGFTPAHSTFNIGQIQSDSEEVKISGSCRLVPTVTQEIYEKWLQQLREDCEKLGARFHVVDYKAPFARVPAGDLYKTCKEILSEDNLSTQLVSTTLASEASFFSRIKCECYVFGAGQSVGSSHIANEHISMKALQSSQEFYKSVIERFCS
jgi:acetylornithine deacetylase/succinyl-diaminopimelate desuccinylase-like protein